MLPEQECKEIIDNPQKNLTGIKISYILYLRLRTSIDQREITTRVVLVSTGILKLGKPSAGRDRAVNRNLKLNANDNYALAA